MHGRSLYGTINSCTVDRKRGERGGWVGVVIGSPSLHIQWYHIGEGRGGCTHFMHSLSLEAVDPRIPTMPRWTTLSFRRSGRHPGGGRWAGGEEGCAFVILVRTCIGSKKTGKLEVRGRAGLTWQGARMAEVCTVLRCTVLVVLQLGGKAGWEGERVAVLTDA